MIVFKELTQKRGFYPLLILAVVIVLVAALIATKPEPPKTVSEEKAWLVSFETIRIQNAAPELALLGSVESPFDATLSAAISADVLAVPVREGQRVEAGELLIELDPREIDLHVQERRAEIDDLMAQIATENNRYQADQQALEHEKTLLAMADKAKNRQQRLRDSNLIAQERFEQAESTSAQTALSITAREQSIADHPNRLKQLKAKLARAETALENALIDAERVHVKAPFAGVVTQVVVAKGERVQIGQALVQLYDRKNIEVRAQIPDRHVDLVARALANHIPISAKANSYGRDISLELERLSGQANRGAGGVDALFIPEEGQSGLILNSTLKLYVQLPELKHVVTLPVSSLYGADRIYRIQEGRLQAIEAEILGKQFSEDGVDRMILRAETLNSGDRIVTTQLPNAITGLKVKTRDDPALATPSAADARGQ